LYKLIIEPNNNNDDSSDNDKDDDDDADYDTEWINKKLIRK